MKRVFRHAYAYDAYAYVVHGCACVLVDIIFADEDVLILVHLLLSIRLVVVR